MKKSFLFAAASMLMAVSTSCSSLSSILPTGASTPKVRAIDVTPKTGELIADLNVQPGKITHTLVWDAQQSKTWKTISEEDLLRYTVYEALDKSRADVMVGMRYKITKTKTANICVISGFPANYVNIRPMPENVVTPVELKANTPYVVLNKDGEGVTTIPVILGDAIVDKEAK